MNLRSLLVTIGFKANDAALDRVDQKVGSVLGKARAMGTAMAVAASGLVAWKTAQAGLAAVDASLKFGEQLGLIQTIMPGNLAGVSRLKAGLQDLSKETGKSLDDLSDGAYQVLSAFGESPDTLDKTRIAAQAATAGAASTADAINFLAAVTRGYGDTSIEATKRAADLGFQAVKDGQTTFPELAASIGKVTPIAKALGVSLDEVFAIMGTSTGVTGNTAEVATQISAAMAALLEKTPAMEKAFRKLGFRSSEAAIRQLGFVGTLQAVIKTANGSQEAISEIFGRKEGLILGLSLAGASAGKFAEELDLMAKSAGAADEAYRAATTGFAADAFKIKQAEAKARELEVRIGEKLSGAFANAKSEMAQFADAVFEQLAPAFDEMQAGSDDADMSFTAMVDSSTRLIKGFLVFTDLVSSTVKAAAIEFSRFGRVMAGDDIATVRRESNAAQAANWEGFTSRFEALASTNAAKGRFYRDRAETERQLAALPAAQEGLSVRIDKLIAELPENASPKEYEAAIQTAMGKTLRQYRRDLARDMARGSAVDNPSAED